MKGLQTERRLKGVPVLSRKEIERIAEQALETFNVRLLQEPDETDIDRFAEIYLGRRVEFRNLSRKGNISGEALFGGSQAVPVYVPETDSMDLVVEGGNVIMLDRKLADAKEERFRRYVLAHECGHVLLHGAFFEENVMRSRSAAAAVCTKRDIFGESNLSAGYRSGVDYGLLEWQANAFASAILMPAPAVRQIIEQPIWDRYENIDRYYLMVNVMASIFKVPRKVVKNRLAGMNIVPELCLKND